MASRLALLAIFCVVAMAAAGSRNSLSHNLIRNNKYHEEDNNHQQQQHVEPFRAGREYQFRYDAQTASGFAPAVSGQRAFNRIAANVVLSFRDAIHATMRLKNVRIAQLNADTSVYGDGSEAELLPLSHFDRQILPAPNDEANRWMELLEAKLAAPVDFIYTTNGEVGSICFNEVEDAASKNMKKAVLNMIQLKLKNAKDDNHFTSMDELYNRMDERSDVDERVDERGEMLNGNGKTIRNFETTIEGECDALYTITPNDYANSRQKRWNVTKSIDFARCSKLADVAYGFQMHSAQPHHLWNAMSTSGSVIPIEKYDRSTVMRYVLNTQSSAIEERDDIEGNALPSAGVSFGIEKVELVSEYIYKPNSANPLDANVEMSEEETMQTIATARLIFLKAKNAQAIKKEEYSNEETEESEVEEGKVWALSKIRNALKEKITGNKQQKTNNKKNNNNNRSNKCAEKKLQTLLYDADFESREKHFYMYGADIELEERRKISQAEFIAPIASTAVEKELEDGEEPIAALFLERVNVDERTDEANEILERADAQLARLAATFVKNQESVGNASGIDAPATAYEMTRLVAAVRTMTPAGLKKLAARAIADAKSERVTAAAREIYVDALAMAATRNTIEQLTQEIRAGNVAEWKAHQLLKSLGSGVGLPAPSDAQADSILGLCKASELKSKSLKDACWLTFGAVVAELGAQTARTRHLAKTLTSTTSYEIVPNHKMDLYKQVLIDQVKGADNIYEKIVALKALGNAAIPSSIEPLIEMAQNAEQAHDLRMHAIDALRRVATRYSATIKSKATYVNTLKKLNTALLPLFVDTTERADIRISAVSTIFSAYGQSPMAQLVVTSEVVDQIAYVMTHEKNEDLIGFVHSMISAYADTLRAQQIKISAHLKTILLAIASNVVSSKALLQRSSYFNRLHVYSGQFWRFASIYAPLSYKKNATSGNSATTKPFPSHFDFQLDSYANGEFKTNAFSMAICNYNMEKAIDELFGTHMGAFSTEAEADGERVGFLKAAANQLSSIFSKLNIKKHKRTSDSLGSVKHQTPYALLTIRINDLDVFVRPITPNALRMLFNRNSNAKSVQELRDAFVETVKRVIFGTKGTEETYDFKDTDELVQLNVVAPLHWRRARTPTSVGLPLKVGEEQMILGWLRTRVGEGAQKNANEKPTTLIAFQPNVNFVSATQMHVWLHPAGATIAGVAQQRAIELFLPLTVHIANISRVEQEVDATRQSSILPILSKLVTLKVPRENVRLVGIHNSPLTFLASRPNKLFGTQKTQLRQSATNKKKIDLDEKEEEEMELKNPFEGENVDPTIDTLTGGVAQLSVAENAKHFANMRNFDSLIQPAEHLRMPLRVYGNWMAKRAASGKCVVQMLKEVIQSNGEAFFHVDFVPMMGETPTEIHVKLGGILFQTTGKNADRKQAEERVESVKRPWASIRDGLESFYARFENAFFSAPTQRAAEKAAAGAKRYSDAHRAAHDYLEQSVGKSAAYRHALRVELEALGGRRTFKADARLEAICDAKLRACETHLDLKRSPLAAYERQEWTLKAMGQVIYPEYLRSISQFTDEIEGIKKSTKDNTSHMKLFTHMLLQWGSVQTKQELRVNMLAQPSTQMIRETLARIERAERRVNVRRQMSPSYTRPSSVQVEDEEEEENEVEALTEEASYLMGVPFLDEFNAVVSYELHPRLLQLAERMGEILKTQNFFTTKVSQIESGIKNNNLKNNNKYGVKSGELKATLRMDLISAGQYNNLTWEIMNGEEGMERVEIEGIEMPVRIQPISLIRTYEQKSAHTLAQFLSNMIVKKSYGKGYTYNKLKNDDAISAQSPSTSSSSSSSSEEGGDDVGTCQIYSNNAINTFDGVIFDAPLSKCYSLLAQDCSTIDGTPRFAILMKAAASRSNNEKGMKKMKIITQRQIIVIEPLHSQSTNEMAISLKADDLEEAIVKLTNEKADSNQIQALAQNGIEFVSNGQRGKREFVLVEIPSLFRIEFNGKTAKIQLPEEFKNSQCGLCGNFDDDAANELRNYGGKADLKSFHKSYSIVDEDEEECNKKSMTDFFNSQKFGQVKMPKQNLNENSWEYDQSNEEGKNFVKPVNQTYMMEYNQKICFSMTPIPQCPDGWYAADAIGSGESDILKRTPVKFACLPRNSIETRSLRAEVRRTGIVGEIGEFESSYHELMVLPERCLAY